MADAGQPAGVASDFPLASLLLALWWIGAIGVATATCSALVRAWRLRARCVFPGEHSLVRLLDAEQRRMGIRRPVTLLLSDEPGLAATVGTLRPVVVIGRDVASLPLDELRPLFIHELAHVKRQDYLSYLLAMLVLPFYWPNPLVWWTRRKAEYEREEACDDEVLRQGVASPFYAQVLLKFAIARAGLAPIAGAPVAYLRASATRERIGSILNRARDRRPLGALLGIALAAAIGAVVVPAASMRWLASEPGTGTHQELLAALGNDDPVVRARAAHTLGRRNPGRARKVLEASLDDPDSRVRRAAIEGLVQLADPALLPALVRVLDRPFGGKDGEHGFVLKYAMLTVGRIGSPKAIRVLERQLDRPVKELRWLALETILSMPGGASVARPHLERFATSDPAERNRRLARKALSAL